MFPSNNANDRGSEPDAVHSPPECTVPDELWIRRMQVSLRAVKTCRTCGRTLPIQNYRLPSMAYYRGLPDCLQCCRDHERERNRNRRHAA